MAKHVISENGDLVAQVAAMMTMGISIEEILQAHGRYHFTCHDEHGNLKWEDTIDNTVMTPGKNLMLDTFLAGTTYTTTGPYMGLISSVSYSAISAADTMASHSGWTEAGGANAPTYTGNRKTAVFSSASAGSKALSSALAYTIGSTGTLKGAFMALGTGAVNTKDDTNGTLLSAGLFTGGDRAVLLNDVVNGSWSLAV